MCSPIVQLDLSLMLTLYGRMRLNRVVWQETAPDTQRANTFNYDSNCNYSHSFVRSISNISSSLEWIFIMLKTNISTYNVYIWLTFINGYVDQPILYKILYTNYKLFHSHHRQFTNI